MNVVGANEGCRGAANPGATAVDTEGPLPFQRNSDAAGTIHSSSKPFLGSLVHMAYRWYGDYASKWILVAGKDDPDAPISTRRFEALTIDLVHVGR